MRTDVVAAHADATRLDIHELVRILNENVGSTVVQAMTGTKDRGQPAKWARPDGPEPRHNTVNQLRLGYRVWHLLEQAEGPDVALAWLVGANPRLGERTPVSAVRDLDSADVIGAVLAFIDGSPAA
ncbi:hypothetical protein SAMN05216184_1198 [Georgenia satyanarayanai]|uniref:Antitoxin Xre/MbcA/ParS-like toxin-binding domain-containing protein n=1 Tax=Georgenia satyanarayanai TaxID=860221 RepID=A0A2Y9AS06_9MICO|nr:hypothetical protein [Georgenia satyanarayanai]PYF96348.1 hypothetical protein A8987_1198 [Georgenia satyanarayanai]SSA46875.1 hypothetical protein SAMN05216184_1198 [Georgenia satyanarayanai]